MGITLANNAKSTLSAAATSTDTVLYVTDVSSFPALGAGDYFNATLESTSGAYEIVRVTQINTASLNVTRGQEDTIAIPFSSGARIELRTTVQNLTDFLLTGSNVNDDAYGAGWNGDNEDAPSRNAVYDKFVTVDAALASYTAADVLAKLLTVDGSGSGLDADLLDGLSSAAFAQLSGATFSGSVVSPNYTASHLTLPYFEWVETSAAPDSQRWRMYVSGQDFTLQSLSDAGASSTWYFVAHRSGNTATYMDFGVPIRPNVSDGSSLGDTSKMWSDLYLASGGVINFNNGDVTLTHSSNALTGSGGQFLWTYGAAATTPPARFTNTTDAGNNTALIIETDRATPTAYDTAWIDWYASNNAGTQVYAGAYGIALSDITAGSVDGVHYWRLAVNSVTTDKMYLTTSGLAPYTNDGLTLGFGASAWSDLFLASGGVINFNNGDVTITHSTDLLAGTGGQLVWSQATAAAAIKTINNLDTATMQLLRLDHDRATPTAGDLGYISFYSSDSAGNQDEFGRIAVEASSVTSTSEIGELRFYGITSGSLVHRANINASTFRPGSNDGLALGTATVSFSDLFLASGAVIGFNNGDVTLTHSSNTLTFGGASSGYIFDAVVRPSTNDGAALGSATVSFSDVFLADGAVINYANGSATITHNVADDSITVSNGGLQTPTRVSTETGGTLTSASRNCIVRCATAPTLPASGMSDGDFIIIDPRGTARTVTRPAAHTMYKNDVDSATVTTYAHNVLTAVYHGSSKWTVSGAA